MHGEAWFRSLATQVLDASGADETELVISGHEQALTRFANSTIHQNVFEATVEVRVRAVLGTRIGVATTERTDERSLRSVVAQAIESAGYAPENPEFRGLPRPLAITPVSAHAAATASYSPERRARDVKAICDQSIAQGLNASGAWSTGEMELAVANSHGVWAYDPRTHASLKTVIMGDNSSGYAERTAVATPRSKNLTRCFGTPSKSKATGTPAGSSPSSHSVTFSPTSCSPKCPFMKLRPSWTERAPRPMKDRKSTSVPTAYGSSTTV